VKLEYLHITVVVEGPFESTTCTLQLLLEALLKAGYLHITVVVERPFKSRVLTH